MRRAHRNRLATPTGGIQSPRLIAFDPAVQFNRSYPPCCRTADKRYSYVGRRARLPRVLPNTRYKEFISLAEGVVGMREANIFDPEGLTTRCNEIFTLAFEAAHGAISENETSLALQLKEMRDTGQMSKEDADLRLELLIKAGITGEEIEHLVGIGIGGLSGKWILRLVWILLLLLAFLASHFLEPLLRVYLVHTREIDLNTSPLFLRTVVFICEIVLLAPLLQRVESQTYWMIFRRTRRRLLSALDRLKEICQKRIALAEDALREPWSVVAQQGAPADGLASRGRG